ncbi:MAG TPA: hypothetical protein VGP41_15445 [Candidatus Lustribacter sp.]|jgi:hypothetical protein|nr:hypothetical protein [Candidatus Lustribacter sp.]
MGRYLTAVRAVDFLLGMAISTAALACPALAQTPAPGPSASPSPAPTPTPRALGWQFATTLDATFVDQNTSGPGQIGPEAAGFIAGSPLSPNTPYDLFSSAPLTPGVAGVAEGFTTATYRTPAFDVNLTAGLTYLNGNITNAAYWGENLMPALNPHLGSQALPYAIAFPTAPGQGDGNNFRLSVLGGSIATADGNLILKGGYFDLTQTQRFVFAQPALTNVNPAIAYAPAETLSNGLAGTDVWQPFSSQLQLSGVDVVAKRGIATFEASSAALPSLPGTSARIAIASVVFDHGEGTRYAVEVLHANTSGMSFTTTVPFGANPQFLVTPQGTLPTSTLSGQQQTIAGVHAAFHLVPAWKLDAVADVGRAWYDAQNVAQPGTSSPGGYYHAGLATTFGRATATLDFYRMESRYATMILPYGVPENQWSAAFAWPGQWLKSNYQLIDNSVLGVNRQGYRFRYYVDKGALEWHVEYTNLYQIDPETTVSSLQTGFIDGYYLPQLPANATLGRQQRYAGWVAWHPRIGDLTLDYVNDQLNRPALVPTDLVAYQVPQVMLTFARHFSPNVTGSVGAGRYGMIGTFSEPIDFWQRLYFVGAIVKETPQASILVSFRRSNFGGITTFPLSPLAPNFTGSLLIVEQRYQF